MNAIRNLFMRAYDNLFPPVDVADLPTEQYEGWRNEQHAEQNRRAEARIARIERERAALRRDLKAEEDNMRRRR
jgi:hypothetical protein